MGLRSRAASSVRLRLVGVGRAGAPAGAPLAVDEGNELLLGGAEEQHLSFDVGQGMSIFFWMNDSHCIGRRPIIVIALPARR